MRRTALETGVAEALLALGTPSAGERLVVGVSGGPDSVALLDALASLAPRQGFTVVAAHLDHGLRPDSAEDAAFSRDLCARRGLGFHTEWADVRARARVEGGGVEEAARRERHAFLARVKEKEGACAIALAHTRDDQAETVLLRLLRGAGSLGLSAMRPRSGDLLRPMLAVSRSDVFEHLARRGLAWRDDPSNSVLAIARNRVRHELIPYLERHFNPAVREALARSATLLAEDSDVMARVAADAAGTRGRREGDGYVLSRAALREAPRAVARLGVRRALQETGGLRGVGLRHVDAVLDLAGGEAPSGRRVDLPGGRQAVFHFDEVRIGPRRLHDTEPFAFPLTVPGSVALPDGTSLVARPVRGPASRGGASSVIALPDGPLVVRTRRPGDRVRAAGRELSLRRFLMDRRVPAQERASLALLAAGERILWVSGQPVESAEGGTGRFARVEVHSGPPGRAR
ncbi:MAG TPA: tRNA lysidine(34) synthetase TilS [Vicinamibacteria bacterium]|nr:tRNA lysidine(34) synthetase TilS [Vicinamibacteria bacterium]